MDTAHPCTECLLLFSYFMQNIGYFMFNDFFFLIPAIILLRSWCRWIYNKSCRGANCFCGGEEDCRGNVLNITCNGLSSLIHIIVFFFCFCEFLCMLIVYLILLTYVMQVRRITLGNVVCFSLQNEVSAAPIGMMGYSQVRLPWP